ncbi:MAG: hypothetical protein AAGH90_06360 [Pseudomonadota bacterium]
MKKLVVGTSILVLAACATEPYPFKRPLTPEVMEQLSDTNVVVDEPTDGLGASWFMQDSSATGAQYGLIGALTTAVMDGIANAGPSSRARRVATQANDAVDSQQLLASLKTAFADAAEAQSGDLKVSYGDIDGRTIEITPGTMDDSISISLDYKFAENAAAFQVNALVKVDREDIAYTTPYVFESSVPKAETEGSIYRNRFVYFSEQLEVPAFTDEIKAKLIEFVRDSYRDADGNLPDEESKEFRDMSKALEKAEDDDFSKSEASIFMISKWTENDAALLISELDKAHAFIADYTLIDLNDPSIPSLEGDELIVATDDKTGRIVAQFGSGPTAGTYTSKPGGVTDFVTYGNAIAYSKAAMDRSKALEKSRDES